MLSLIEAHPNVDLTVFYVIGAVALAFSLYRYHQQHS